MTRSLFALLALAAALSAQPATTPIRDTVYDQFGVPYTGTVTFQLATTATDSSGRPILSLLEDAKRVRIVNGVLSVNLVPNDTMRSGMSYVATFGNAGRKYCVIPTSATPITLASACSDAVPSRLLLLNSSGLSGSNLCVNILSNQLSLSTGCGGTITALSWIGMTNSDWLSMTISNWDTIVP